MSGAGRRAALVAALAWGALAPAAALGAGEPGAPLTREALGELTYPGVLAEIAPPDAGQDAVRLRGGRWTGRSVEPGLAAGTPSVALIPYLVARGDLDGDGREDAVVFLQSTAGGTGAFLHLAAVLDGPQGARALPAQEIGDRAEVEGLEVVAGRIVLDAVVAGPSDALCCPSQRVRRVFAVADGGLREVDSELRGRLSVRGLAGTTWLLTGLDATTPVPADAGVVLRFEPTAVAGSAGCNTFRADVLSGERDALEIGPLTTTRRTCPEPVLRREQRFLAALGRATRIAFWFGRLEIQYDTPERRTGRLRFAPAAPG